VTGELQGELKVSFVAFVAILVEYNSERISKIGHLPEL